MLPKICRADKCDRKLRSDNVTGVCKIHRNRWGTCRRCLSRCDWRSVLCTKCHLKNKKSEAEFMIYCWFSGCVKRVRSKTGYCREHWKLGPTCKSEGCSIRVVQNCKRGYCRDHDFLASRERYREKRNRLILSRNVNN